jgi:hypothetical protein
MLAFWRSCPVGYAASLMRRKSFNVGAEVVLESMASETTGFDPLGAVHELLLLEWGF